jgi:hypothetical protein
MKFICALTHTVKHVKNKQGEIERKAFKTNVCYKVNICSFYRACIMQINWTEMKRDKKRERKKKHVIYTLNRQLKGFNICV